jgi:hypothetical protein
MNRFVFTCFVILLGSMNALVAQVKLQDDNVDEKCSKP